MSSTTASLRVSTTAIESELPAATYSFAFVFPRNQRGGVSSDGNVDDGIAREVDARHAPRLGDPAIVDAHRLRPRVAALVFAARCAGVGLGPPSMET